MPFKIAKLVLNSFIFTNTSLDIAIVGPCSVYQGKYDHGLFKLKVYPPLTSKFLAVKRRFNENHTALAHDMSLGDQIRKRSCLRPGPL